MVHGEQKLPDGWQWTTLGKIANYINGRAFKPTEWEITGRPIIRIQNLTGSTGTLNRFSGEVEPKYIIRDGDLLISWSATLGAFIYRGEEAVLNQHIFKVEPFINKKFLYYLVTAYLDTLKRQVHGSGMQHITKGKFDNSPVPLPPPDEQEWIVAKIEELFTQLEAGTSALERVRAGLRRYKASVLKAAVEGKLVGNGNVESDALPEGWRWSTLPEIGHLGRGKSKHRPRNAEFLYGGKYPFIQTGDVRHADGVITSYAQTYSEAGLAQSKLWKKGTLCITIAANIAETAILGIDACFPDSVVGFIPNNDVDVKFVEFYIRTIKDNLERYAPATAQKNINLDVLQKVEIPLPPLEEQRRIVAEVERRLSVARQAENSVEEALLRASRLRQAVLKSAFDGRLT